MKNNDKLVVGTGQAHELTLAFGRNKWTNADIKSLSEGDFLTQIRPLVKGYAEVKIIEPSIDCTVCPYCPEGFVILPDKKQIQSRFKGQLKWNREVQKNALFTTEEQMNEKLVNVGKLREGVIGQRVLPANVADFLLKNPNHIPEEWDDIFVYFWGTIFQGHGRFWIRSLCGSGNTRECIMVHFDDYTGSEGQAALAAS